MIDMYSDGYRRNPYPYFQKMRSASPVFQLHNENHWAVLRYDDVKSLLKNHELFSSADIVKEPDFPDPDFLLYTRGMVGRDKPDHTRLRQLLFKLFTKYKTDYFESVIRNCCQQLLYKIKDIEKIDFVKSFSAPLPIMVISRLLGIDEEKAEEFRHWVLILLTWRLSHYPDKEANLHKMFLYLTETIAKRKISPGSDLISALVLSSINDHAITPNEVLAFVRLLLVGGTDTTTNLLSTVFRIFLDNPEYIDYLKQEPHKLDDFIDETLRYDGPVLNVYRRVTQDTVLNDVTFKKNDLIFLFIASANHDETVFANAEHFSLARDFKTHLSFGSGIHHCFSSQLAKLQVRIACEEILNGWDFKYTDSKPLSYIESFFFRGLKNLPIKKQTISL